MGFLNNVQFCSSNERMQQIKQAHLQQQSQQAVEEKQNNRSSVLYSEKYEMKLEKSNILMLGPTGKAILSYFYSSLNHPKILEGL